MQPPYCPLRGAAELPARRGVIDDCSDHSTAALRFARPPAPAHSAKKMIVRLPPGQGRGNLCAAGGLRRGSREVPRSIDEQHHRPDHHRFATI